ncbi:MAG TPA: maleylpyruvate isomerase family mycothiol-dependent enzyme, partial [Streptosporangiaceae bacterium]|nr:maleylpyruvate isomerase family mycothiol-dependent enzyme [Streptosporangiaceae bacterium]
MDSDRHIAALEAEGLLLAQAAERAGLTAAVPSCPAWQVRDLVRHQGYVHRWAGAYVTVPIRTEAPELTEAEQLACPPADDRLLEWFRDGHDSLVRALRSADPAMIAWTFLGAPSPLAFWARRQAHETAIHRADAQLAAGQAPGYEPDFAADGVDELIMGFLGRQDAHPGEPGGTRPGEPALDRTLLIRATDTGQQWRAEL